MCLEPAANMAAAVMTGTWRRAASGAFCPLGVLAVLLGAINAVVAAPETGLWKITVLNVSIKC